jgi:DNA-binding transcriptional LysR family regulator
LEFRQLSHFVAVAEERSFTQAARRAHIVQSGISASIGALERELGVVLFKRSKHHVDLTEAGKALLGEARRALAAVAAARVAATSADAGLTGSLVIGVVPTMPLALPIPAALQRFHAAHPHVAIRIREYAVPTHAAVRAGEVEIAIGPGHGPPGITSIPLGSYPLVVVCPLKHRLAGRRSVSIATLADEALIEPPVTWVTRRLVDRAFADAGIERHTAFEVDEIVLILRLVQEGLGIAILPEVARQFASEVRYIPLRPRLGSWDVTVSFLGHEPPSAVGRAFYKMLMEQMAKGKRRVRAPARARS